MPQKRDINTANLADTTKKTSRRKKSASYSPIDRENQKKRVEATLQKARARNELIQNNSKPAGRQNTYNKLETYFPPNDDLDLGARYVTKADSEISDLADSISNSRYAQTDSVGKSIKNFVKNLAEYKAPNGTIFEVIELQREIGKKEASRIAANQVINDVSKKVGKFSLFKSPFKKASSLVFGHKTAVADDRQVRTWFIQKTKTSQDLAQVVYATKDKVRKLGIFRYFHSPMQTYKNHCAHVLALSLREFQHEKRNSKNKLNNVEWLETIQKYRSYAELLFATNITKPEVIFPTSVQNPYNSLEKLAGKMVSDNFKLKSSHVRDINLQIDRLMDALTQAYHKANLDSSDETPSLRNS